MLVCLRRPIGPHCVQAICKQSGHNASRLAASSPAAAMPGACRPCSGACRAEADFGVRRGLGARQRSLASRFRFYARRRASARRRRNLRIRLRAGCHYAELLPCGGSTQFVHQVASTNTAARCDFGRNE